jgi:hypothetical protein
LLPVAAAANHWMRERMLTLSLQVFNFRSLRSTDADSAAVILPVSPALYEVVVVATAVSRC